MVCVYYSAVYECSVLSRIRVARWSSLHIGEQVRSSTRPLSSSWTCGRPGPFSIVGVYVLSEIEGFLRSRFKTLIIISKVVRVNGTVAIKLVV